LKIPRLKTVNIFWRGAGRPLAIAHRGAGAVYGPKKHLKENTLEAFRGAQAAGIRYLETDVIYSHDRKVITIHVAKNRFEAARRLPAAPNYRKLQKLSHDQIKSALGREVPTLEEVLLEFPDARFFIDAKTKEVVKPLTDVILKTGAMDRVLLWSFYISRVKKMRRLLGDKANLGLILGRYPRLVNRNLNSLIVGRYQNLSLRCVGIPFMLMSRQIVQRLHKRRLEVYVWASNEQEKADKAIAFGADGIIVDDIELLRKINN
jgi:glycerophosphoryl diester phosphodiesterase